MSEGGLSESACVDFDLAVEEFGAWVERRANETEEQDAPPSPKRTKIRVPKYATIAEVLGLTDEETMVLAPDEDQDAKAAELLDAFNRGALDWQTFMKDGG